MCAHAHGNRYGMRIYKNVSALLMHIDKIDTHVISSIVHVDHERVATPRSPLPHASNRWHKRPHTLSCLHSLALHTLPSIASDVAAACACGGPACACLPFFHPQPIRLFICVSYSLQRAMHTPSQKSRKFKPQRSELTLGVLLL